eukprot:5599-Amorphochlora_amoeboformis.AAC.2
MFICAVYHILIAKAHVQAVHEAFTHEMTHIQAYEYVHGCIRSRERARMSLKVTVMMWGVVAYGARGKSWWVRELVLDRLDAAGTRCDTCH